MFAIDELKENISDESKELYEDYKRLIEYIINLKTITIIEKKQKIREILDKFKDKVYTDLYESKNNIEEFKETEKTFNNHSKNSDNVFISKKVINKNKIILISKYAFVSAKKNLVDGVSKVLKNHGV